MEKKGTCTIQAIFDAKLYHLRLCSSVSAILACIERLNRSSVSFWQGVDAAGGEAAEGGETLEMLPSRSGCIDGESEGGGRVAAREDAGGFGNGDEECRYPLASFTAVELPRILYSWSMSIALVLGLPLPMPIDCCPPMSSLGRFLDSSSWS